MTRLQLIVEGLNDKHVIGHLLVRRGFHVEETISTKVAQGIAALLENLSIYLLGSYDAHAIVVDADLNVASRWDELRHRLTISGYEDVPPEPEPDGLVLRTVGKPSVGVWIMPDNTIPGSLEHFVHHLVPGDDILWPLAKQAVADIPAAERRFSSSAKAEIHTWLAWQEEPGTAMGSAITKRYFASDSRLADRFVAWIERLQGLAS